MWLGLLITTTLAAPALDVDVRPDPPKVRPARLKPVTPGSVPLTSISVSPVIDGHLEPLWEQVTSAPSLLIGEDQQAAISVVTQFATTPEALWVAASHLPLDHTATLVIDPDGARRFWLRIIRDRDGTTAERCSLHGIELVDQAFIPSRAVPCRPHEGPLFASDGDTWEAMIPWESIPLATSRMKLMLRVAKGREELGSWASNGQAVDLPERGAPIRMPQPKGRLTVDVDPRTDAWIATLRGAEDGIWFWRRTHFGVLRDWGKIIVDSRETTWTLPALQSMGGALTLRRARIEPIAPGFLHMVYHGPSRLQLITPTHSGQIMLSYDLSGPAKEVPIRIASSRGRVLAETTADIPQGKGVIVVTAPWHWPRTVSIEVPPWLPHGQSTRIRRASGG